MQGCPGEFKGKFLNNRDGKFQLVSRIRQKRKEYYERTGDIGMNMNTEGIRVKAEKWPKLGFLEAGRLERFFWEGSVFSDMSGAGVTSCSCLAGEREIAFRHDATMPDSPEDLLEMEVAGLVVISPGRADIDWIIDSLRHGIPVFCREPPILNGDDAERVVSTARKHNCLFDIDFAYRHINGMPELRQHIRQGDLGTVHALDLTFRYGRAGVQGVALKESADWNYIIFHLVDLVLWLFDYTEVTEVKIYPSQKSSKILSGGVRQDFVLASFGFINGTTVNLGYADKESQCDAVIDMGIYGECDSGMVAAGNDSLFSFVIDRFRSLEENGPDNMALTAWLERLCASTSYDKNIETFVKVSRLVERVNNR